MDYDLILKHNFPNAEWSLNNNDYDQLIWLLDSEKPTKQELDDLWEVTLDKIETEKQAKAEAKATAQAKLAALGLTVEDLKALGL